MGSPAVRHCSVASHLSSIVSLSFLTVAASLTAHLPPSVSAHEGLAPLSSAAPPSASWLLSYMFSYFPAFCHCTCASMGALSVSSWPPLHLPLPVVDLELLLLYRSFPLCISVLRGLLMVGGKFLFGLHCCLQLPVCFLPLYTQGS